MDRIGSDIRRELGRFGPVGAMPEMVAAWPAVVGETVAANAWPARVARDGTLHVNASSSTWAFELQQLESEIAERLRAAVGAGAPPRLRFAPGPLPEAIPEPAAAAQKAPPEPTVEHARTAHEWAEDISSENLRKTVEKAARMSLARAADDRSAC
jgi:hypothetical protein